MSSLRCLLLPLYEVPQLLPQIPHGCWIVHWQWDRRDQAWKCRRYLEAVHYHIEGGNSDKLQRVLLSDGLWESTRVLQQALEQVESNSETWLFPQSLVSCFRCCCCFSSADDFHTGSMLYISIGTCEAVIWKSWSRLFLCYSNILHVVYFASLPDFNSLFLNSVIFTRYITTNAFVLTVTDLYPN